MRTPTFVKMSGLALITVLLCATFALPSFATTSTTAATQPIVSLYSGYEVTGAYTTLRVKGSWIVPTANCLATPNSVSNITTAFDAINGESDGFLVGTYSNCNSGNASYGAFFLAYPTDRTYGYKSGQATCTTLDNVSECSYAMEINPGDIIEAQGTWRSPSGPIDWNTNLIDETSCNQTDIDAYTATGFTPVQDSGAVILSSDGQILTSLSTVQSGVQFTRMAQSCGAGIAFTTSSSDGTGPETKSVVFGTWAKTSGFSLKGLQIPGTGVSSLLDGSSFEITGA